MVEILSLTNFLHDRIATRELSEAELEETLIRFRLEAEKYKREIYSAIASSANVTLQPHYVQTVIGALEFVSDQLFRDFMDLTAKGMKGTMQTYLFLISSELTAMMDLFRHIAPHAVDHEHKVPYSHVLILEKETTNTVKVLRQLQKRLDAHTAELVPLLQHLLEESVTYGVTSKKYDYLRVLLSSLSRLPSVKVRDYNYLLHYQLIIHNFNHPDYIQFCNGKLDEKFANTPVEEKLHGLRVYDMKLSGILPSDNIAFNEIFPAAKDALYVYVKEEIDFLYPTRLAMGEVKKIHTDMTVAQLGLLGRIAKQSGEFTESSMSGLYRLMSQYFTARGTDNISPESIQSKGNHATPETKVAMINIMLKWIELIRAS
jgi:hypothetical protein